MYLGKSRGGGRIGGQRKVGKWACVKREAVRVPRRREKERTEAQTWCGAALGTLSRALGMDGLYSASLCPAVNFVNEQGLCTHLGTLDPLKALKEERAV